MDGHESVSSLHSKHEPDDSETQPIRRKASNHHPIDRTGLHPEDFETSADDEDADPKALVSIPPEDPAHPWNWPTGKKIFHTMAYGITTFTAQLSASVISPGIVQVSKEFHVGKEVGTLAFSIYVMGNMVGPMIFAPVSELYGRKVGVFIPCFISGVFVCVCANVSSVWALLVFRFLAGVFASAPIVTSGGAMADLWKPNQRVAALVLYATSIVTSSSSAPVLGALLVDTGSYGWRWTCWLGGLLQLLIPFINFIVLSETYLPVLEAKRAQQIRHLTGQWQMHAKHEEWNLDFHEMVHVHLARPFLMFLTPIIFLMVLFGSFVYGVLFLAITSVGELLQQYHDFGFIVSYLPLFSIFIGFMIGGMFNIIGGRRYARIAHETGRRPPPEERLPAMMLTAWTMPAGLFIYGWTLYRDVHWITSCVGVLAMGTGLAVVFQGCLVYIVDAYTRYSASGIAANTFMRSIFGGVFPLFANQMYKHLGPHWGNSLLAFVSLAALPIPWLFYFHGAKIRARDPFKDILR